MSRNCPTLRTERWLSGCEKEGLTRYLSREIARGPFIYLREPLMDLSGRVHWKIKIRHSDVTKTAGGFIGAVTLAKLAEEIGRQ